MDDGIDLTAPEFQNRLECVVCGSERRTSTFAFENMIGTGPKYIIGGLCQKDMAKIEREGPDGPTYTRMSDNLTRELGKYSGKGGAKNG